MSKKAYMAFAADAPMVGLDPHPGYAPADTIRSFDAAGYMEALGAEEDRATLEEFIKEHHEHILQAVEDGDMEDADEMDEIFEIEIHDDGRVDVIHDDPRYVFASFTMKDAYEAFGMKMPAQPVP